MSGGQMGRLSGNRKVDKVCREKQKTHHAQTWWVDVGSSTWARTRDLRINSPALYRLSYRGMIGM
jgi:hypothetical protein